MSEDSVCPTVPPTPLARLVLQLLRVIRTWHSESDNYNQLAFDLSEAS